MDKHNAIKIHFNLRNIMFLVGILLVPLANTAYAESNHHDNKMQRMAEELELTDMQRQDFKQIHRNARAEKMRIRNAMKDNRGALKKLSPSVSNYNEKLVKLANRRAELVKNKIILRGHMKAKVHHILTPEQRQKAMSMRRGQPRSEHKRKDTH